jgi:outer membrane lipoprotein SlyB
MGIDYKERKREDSMKHVGMMMMMVIAALAAGCASSQSGEVYSRNQARSAMTVKLGTVEFVKQVKVEGTQSGVGAVAGGIAGGVGGNMIGGGKGRTLATLGGAAAGALVGNVAEEKITKYDGLEITVRLDSGAVTAVVQEADVMFYVGDRVRVLTGSDGTTRVAR